ncbi:MarR family winged helix-turn-helix transcriptional regulator [Gemmatimonas sp.]
MTTVTLEHARHDSSAKPTATPAHAVHALRTAAAHVERALAWALEPFGITTAQFELLQVIERHGKSGAGCSELGRHLAAPGPDVTRMLDRLDSAGLVARKRDNKDRRVVHTELTEKGEELITNAGPAVQHAELSVLDGLADSERAQLALLLQGVRRNCPGN